MCCASVGSLSIPMQLKFITLCTCVEAFLYIVYFAQVRILKAFFHCAGTF
jgi:hypothetical protein